jgi:hypothetical protein
MPRFFTLEQARELLPRAKALIERAVESKSQYFIAEGWTEDFVRRVMLLGGVLVDREPYERNRNAQVKAGERLKSAVEEIQSYGIVVKDLDVGLIDFPTLFRGNEVYLCWRIGEDDLSFWHGVNEGFDGRKSIDKEFLDNHRGRDAD